MRARAPGPTREHVTSTTRTVVRRGTAAVTIAALLLATLTGSAPHRIEPPTVRPGVAAALTWPDPGMEARELRRVSRTQPRSEPAPTAAAVVVHRTRRVHAPAAPARTSSAPASAAPATARGPAATVVAFALAQVGKSYVFGTTGPNTFDCSGLVVAAYRLLGIGLPHFTGALAGRGRPVDRSQLEPGDLVFPSSGHVGIYVGRGLIVHASTPRGGVKLGPIYSFVRARRIL